MKLIKPTPSNNYVRGWIPGTHRGIDWGWQTSRVEESMKILAAAPGTVLDVYTGDGYNQGWGRRIRVDHGHGNVTTYNHIRPGGVLVKPGQQVTAGQLIAHMGSSGAATGTHLHFELYLNGVRVDPNPYFSTDLPGTASGGSSGAPAGNTGQVFSVPAGGQYYYWQYQNALNGNYASSQWLRGGQTLPVVENPGTGPVRVRAADGDLVWVGTRNHPAATSGGAPAPAPAPQGRKLNLPTGWFWYRSAAEAQAMRNPRGGKYGGGIMLSGPYPVLSIASNGAIQVRSNSVGDVWLHSSAAQHLA